MIQLKYITCCDHCGRSNEREVKIENVDVVDKRNQRHFFNLCTPLVPAGWITTTAKRVGDPDRIFCSRICQEDFNKTQVSHATGDGHSELITGLSSVAEKFIAALLMCAYMLPGMAQPSREALKDVIYEDAEYVPVFISTASDTTEYVFYKDVFYQMDFEWNILMAPDTIEVIVNERSGCKVSSAVSGFSPMGVISCPDHQKLFAIDRALKVTVMSD